MSLFRATSAHADDRNADDRTADDRTAGDQNTGYRGAEDRNADGRTTDDLNAHDPNAGDRAARDRAARDRAAGDRNSTGRTTGGLDPNSRTAAREPYRIVRVPGQRSDDQIPDGPTQLIDARILRRGRRSRGHLFVLVVAMLALNLAGVAGLLAWRAFGLARVTAAGERPPPATPGTTRAPEARTGYSVAYAQEPLRVQVGCSAVMFLDLDEPRANAGENVSDLRYDSRCGMQPPDLTLGPGATAGAQVTGGDLDAAGCGEAIRTSPLGPGAAVEVRKGAELCVLTAASPPDMVLVEVTDVGRTGLAGMRATSWKVTG
jgi:hypothetical protein